MSIFDLKITKPTLLLDKKKCLKNIEEMVNKASKLGLDFRPHFKTHQSVEIGNWFRNYGVGKITVSSFDMAEYFVRNGWKDVLIAFPYNPLEIDRLNRLSDGAQISVIADNLEAIASLTKLDYTIDLYIDVDTGYGRTGVHPGDMGHIRVLIQRAEQMDNVRVAGFYCHAGHSYKAKSLKEKGEIHRVALSALKDLKSHFNLLGPKLLYGDTPNCSTQDDFDGIDEITPGNFVFYDLYQHSIGSCSESDIAVAMACPVVGTYAHRNELVVHGGAVHFSKDILSVNGNPVFGKLVSPDGEGWQPATREIYLTSLSQEHGILEAEDGFIRSCKVGDLLLFHPVHSCLTANLMKAYLTTKSETIKRL